MMMSSMRLMAVVIIGVLNGLVFGLLEGRCKRVCKKNIINEKFENGDMFVDDFGESEGMELWEGDRN